MLIKDEMGQLIEFVTRNPAPKPELTADFAASADRSSCSSSGFSSTRISRRLRTSAGTVKTQIWIAVAAYVLIATAKKRFHLLRSPYAILRISNLTMFEATPTNQRLTPPQLGS
ncbi:MAG: IS4 family transposase, partial [Burkholderiales bacterium]